MDKEDENRKEYFIAKHSTIFKVSHGLEQSAGSKKLKVAEAYIVLHTLVQIASYTSREWDSLIKLEFEGIPGI
jgi:hypothetical protein